MASDQPKMKPDSFPVPGLGEGSSVQDQDIISEEREGQLHDDQSVDNPVPDSTPTEEERLVDRQSTISNLSGG
jgi:hypothetical protein